MSDFTLGILAFGFAAAGGFTVLCVTGHWEDFFLWPMIFSRRLVRRAKEISSELA